MALVIKTVRDELRAVTEEAKALMAKAEQEDRLLTHDERAAIDERLAKAEKLGERIKQSDAQGALAARLEAMGNLAKPNGHQPAVVEHGGVVRSLGQQFVESDAYLEFRSRPGARGGHWATEPVELKAATTVTPATGIVPGSFGPIAPNLFGNAFLRVSSLFASGTITDGSVIPYLRETVFTNAAAPVAENTAKPEATLTFEQVQDPLRTIAHWLPVTDQMLEDVDAIRSYIDARLSDGVVQAEESQLVAGDGIAPNLRGIVNTPGIAPTVAKAVGEGYADAIHRQIMAILPSALAMADAVVVNPVAWHLIATERGAAGGGYLSGGTFLAELPMRLWGLPVVLSPYLPFNDQAIVGAFRTHGMVWRKGGIVVQASNSHADYFVKNLTAIRAEERAQLTIFRPGAFGMVTGLAAA